MSFGAIPFFIGCFSRVSEESWWTNGAIAKSHFHQLVISMASLITSWISHELRHRIIRSPYIGSNHFLIRWLWDFIHWFLNTRGSSQGTQSFRWIKTQCQLKSKFHSHTQNNTRPCCQRETTDQDIIANDDERWCFVLVNVYKYCTQKNHTHTQNCYQGQTTLLWKPTP